MAKPVAEQIELEEHIAEDYEPSEEEIKEYYECLDMDWEKDQDLRWIAIKALKAPLPEGWKPCEDTSTSDIYYFNFKTGESVWDHPMDDHFREVAKKEKAKKANANTAVPGALNTRPKTSFGLSNESANNAFGSSSSVRPSNVVDFDQLMAEQDDEDEEEPDLDLSSSPSVGGNRVSGTMDADLDDDDDDSIDLSDDDDLQDRAKQPAAQQLSQLNRPALDTKLKSMTSDTDQAIVEHERHLKQKLETEKARLDREQQHSIKQHKEALDVQLSKAKADATAASEEELQLLKQTSSKRQQLERDLKKLQEEHDTQVRLLDQARRALDDDKASLKTERTEHAAAVDKLQSAQAKEISELKAAHEKDVAKLQEEHKGAMAAKQTALDQELKELQTKHDGLKAQMTIDTQDLEQQLAQQKENMSKQHSTALEEAREKALVAHEKAVAAMKLQLEQVHTAELEELQDELDTVKAKQDALASLQQDISAAKAEKQQELAEETRALVAKHAADMETLRAEHAAALEKATTVFEQQQKEQEQEVRSAGEARVQKLRDELQSQADAYVAEKEAKAQELADVKREHEQQTAALQADMVQLETTRAELQQQTAELGAKLASLQSSIELKQQELAALQEQREHGQESRAQDAAPPSSASVASESASVPTAQPATLRSEELEAPAHAAPLNHATQQALLKALEASLRQPMPKAAVRSDAVTQQALSGLAEDMMRPQLEETRDDASLARAKRFLSSQRSSLTTRHADLRSLRQTLEPSAVQHLSTDDIVSRLKTYVATEEATLQQQEASLDASLRFFDNKEPHHMSRPTRVTFDAPTSEKQHTAHLVSQDAGFQNAYLRSLSATRPVTVADAAAPVDARVASLLQQSRRNVSTMPTATATLPGSYTSPSLLPATTYSTSLRPAAVTGLPQAPAVTSGQRDFLAEHRRWLSSYRQDMASFDATHSTSLAGAGVFRPRGPMQLRMDSTGVHVQNKATLVP
eukprot:m.13375 g.13375  ORF g.13375 m.13375 type:complete len:984 (-) comp10149_c0_seq1:71-3022(-)